MTYIKLTNIETNQEKTYKSDGMNNKAHSTNVHLDSTKGDSPYPEIIRYWNLYHFDELIETKWIFFTYIDNLSFLGGLLDIALFIPSIFMAIYSFRLGQIEVFDAYLHIKKDDPNISQRYEVKEIELLHTYLKNNYYWIQF